LGGTAFSEVTETERGRMARHAHDAGWDALSRHMLAQTIEQEGIAIRLPLVDA
jgi:hypothetical protein